MYRQATMTSAMPRLVIGALCAALVATTAAAKPPEPTGFGKLKFGMSVDQVKKLFPKMEALSLETNLGVGPLGGPNVLRFRLPKQKVPGAKEPADVEVRFWKGKLWMIAVYYGVANDKTVMAALSEQYGPPTATNAQTSAWTGQHSVLFVEHGPGQYTIQDMAMMKEAQAYVLDLLRKGRQAEALPKDTAQQVNGATLREPAPPATASGTAPTAAPAGSATPKPNTDSPG